MRASPGRKTPSPTPEHTHAADPIQHDGRKGPPRRRGVGRPSNDPEEDHTMLGKLHDGGRGEAAAPAKTHAEDKTRIPFLVLTLFLFLGAALISSAVLWLTEENETVPARHMFQILAEHMGSAFIVAALIGFTYERLIHKTRHKWIQMVSDEQRKATDEALRAFVALTPREILSLLEDIAMRVGKTPTLYKPAREEGNEYTFAGSIGYFKSLVAVRRGDVIEVLREWVGEDSDPKLKFLASDFIGEFRLSELCGELEPQVRFTDWEEIDAEMKGWRLNYAWAASRSDSRHPYRDLADLARRTPYKDVEEWIFFVPFQMKDRDFLKVVKSYLGRDDLNLDRMRMVVHALGELFEAYPEGVKETFRDFREKFNQEPILNEIVSTWRRHNLLPDQLIKTIMRGRRPRAITPTPK
jgi:hypothetical protein